MKPITFVISAAAAVIGLNTTAPGSAFAGGLSCGAPAEPQAVKASFVKDLKPSDSELPSERLKKAGENFKKRYPKTRVASFRLTPIPGIYEAAVGKEVAYFDETARFVFTGRILDMEKGVDITQKRLEDIRRIEFDKLPLDQAVKTVKGTGERKLAVFTDPDCPYSRKLAKTLEKVEDATIYTFLFPLVSIHPEAKAKSEKIWCASDSEKALAHALEGKTLDGFASEPLCKAPIDDIISLAAAHGIGGTPTLINAKGDRTAGALPLENLEAFIGPKADAGKSKAGTESMAKAGAASEGKAVS